MHTTLVFELCSLFLVRDFIILVEIVSNFTVCIWRTLLSNWIKIHIPYSIAYNTCGYFASRVVFFRTPQGGGWGGKYEQWAKCPLVFYAKPSNKRFIIPPQKKRCYFASDFYFFGKSIQKHPDSVFKNDVNNEQNVREYYMPKHWMKG